mgnify:CR=1 FL=1
MRERKDETTRERHTHTEREGKREAHTHTHTHTHTHSHTERWGEAEREGGMVEQTLLGLRMLHRSFGSQFLRSCALKREY